MNAVAAPPVDTDSLARFFQSRAVDEFAAVPSVTIRAPPGRRPADLFPACRTMIIFGKVMGDELFTGSVAEMSVRIAALKAELLDISGDLVRVLEESGSSAVAVSSVVVRDGKVKGSLSLKHCAADAGLGEIGDNGLLLSPRFGIRLGLGAVLTDREIPGGAACHDTPQLCTHCGLCIKACPVKALTGDGIDTFRCLNLTGAIPGPLVSLFVRLMEVKSMEPFLTEVANRVANRSAARCSACLTACPLFKKYTGKQGPARQE